MPNSASCLPVPACVRPYVPACDYPVLRLRRVALIKGAGIIVGRKLGAVLSEQGRNIFSRVLLAGLVAMPQRVLSVPFSDRVDVAASVEEPLDDFRVVAANGGQQQVIFLLREIGAVADQPFHSAQVSPLGRLLQCSSAERIETVNLNVLP